ncbi:lipopolysaccharide biosynthesis protein [Novosphingobium piscinae]|uniref:Lipopolysaccharide biosynthesis protein n=1 Tax=Novosphingobium piscinae TaxID=1507448 RepID=A0A7X1KRE6_9SPHN|nr:lipopolysaccharide biosynthesis protein [Novosphingobium piscinae]
MAALAKGGRTNFFGFLLRLVARIPFLFIASRLYGAAAMGRFASALVMVEFAGMIATLGQKRGLAQRLAEAREHPANAVADALVVTTIPALLASLLLYLFPAAMYPKGHYGPADLWLIGSVWILAAGDLALAALAYRFDVATTVRARAVVEPWALSLSAGALYFIYPQAGLTLAYLISVGAATAVALVALGRAYGWPQGWVPHPARLLPLVTRNLPLAGADAVEWGTRKLDVFILRFFVGEAPLGIYFFAQQFASLPQKLKTSFEPVLGPVITRNVIERNYAAIARQVCQVGFWITAAQAGIALALAIPATGLMGLGGPDFVQGTGALILLLLAEVVAATAVVSEAALVYLARYRNLIASLATIALQAVLTVAGIELVSGPDYGPGWQVAAAAGALMLSLAFASLLKSFLLARILHERINNWRWALVWAVLPAAVIGLLAKHLLPEWASMIVGIPAMIVVYAGLIWRKGFGPEDRVLFRKQVEGERPAG